MDNVDLLFRFKSILRSILTNSVCKTRVLLAVSGGVDSVVMLDLFDSVRDEFNLQIGVATLNHKLRKEAQEEVKFVEKLCRDRGLDFFTEEADVLQYSKEHKLSIEEAARILRYGFLIDVSDNYCYKYIATAHNSNDLLETMILRLIKGTGPYGLVGMNLVNGRFIRPLLFFKREEIEKYARHKDLPFVTDTSNYDIKYNRNFIRHKVIPLLKEINPSVEDASLKLAKGIWELEKYINSTIQSFNEKHSTKIGEYIVFKLHKDKYLQVEQIRRLALSFFGKPIDSEKIERFKKLQQSDKISYKVLFWKDLGIEVSRGWCIMGKVGKYQHNSKIINIPMNKVVTETVIFNDYFLKISSCGIMKGANDKCLSFEVRNWLEGDKLLSGKKVKEFFVEKKIPTFVKHLIPLVVSVKEGKVVYIPYLYEAKGYLNPLGITIETKGGFYFES